MERGRGGVRVKNVGEEEVFLDTQSPRLDLKIKLTKTD